MTETHTTQRDVQGEIIKTVNQSQDAVIEAIRDWSDAVQALTPKLPPLNVPFAGKLPQPEQLVSSAYDFASVSEGEGVAGLVDPPPSGCDFLDHAEGSAEAPPACDRKERRSEPEREGREGQLEGKILNPRHGKLTVSATACCRAASGTGSTAGGVVHRLHPFAWRHRLDLSGRRDGRARRDAINHLQRHRTGGGGWTRRCPALRHRLTPSKTLPDRCCDGCVGCVGRIGCDRVCRARSCRQIDQRCDHSTVGGAYGGDSEKRVR